jgi:hypothetical protein
MLADVAAVTVSLAIPWDTRDNSRSLGGTHCLGDTLCRAHLAVCAMSQSPSRGGHEQGLMGLRCGRMLMGSGAHCGTISQRV